MTDDMASLPNPILAGLAGRCPRCGKGKMFSGFLGLKPACEVCGLDYSFIDAGDGPAVVEALYQPPFWLHAALWLPLILLTTLAPLRLIKGVLIALQYHHKAAEGRLVGRGEQ